MRIKSYFANRVEVAVERATRELGEDAILLNTRHTEGEARELGKYEVVFGTNASEESLDHANEIGDSPEDEFLMRELAAIGDRGPSWQEADEPVPAPAPVVRQARIAQPAAELLPPADPIGAPGVIVMVGPGGAGKTSALMKLAFILSAVRGARVRIVQLDIDRIAALEPMRTFCEILDVPFVLRNSFDAEDLLPVTTSEYVLVDTPGFAPSDGDAPERLAEMIRTVPGQRTHLVVPAWFSPAELPSVLRRYAAFSPAHLLVTRADEVFGTNTVPSLAAACELPLSFVSASRHASAGFANAPFLTQPAPSESAA